MFLKKLISMCCLFSFLMIFASVTLAQNMLPPNFLVTLENAFSSDFKDPAKAFEFIYTPSTPIVIGFSIGVNNSEGKKHLFVMSSPEFYWTNYVSFKLKKYPIQSFKEYIPGSKEFQYVPVTSKFLKESEISRSSGAIYEDKPLSAQWIIPSVPEEGFYTIEATFDNTSIQQKNSTIWQGKKAVETDRFQVKEPKTPQEQAKFFLHLGGTHWQQREYKQAIQMALKALETDPSLTQVYCFLGSCYQATGELEKALESLETCIKYHPPNYAKDDTLIDYEIQELKKKLGKLDNDRKKEE